MAAVSRIRDPQRLVELVADTMFRERNLAARTRRTEKQDDERTPASDDPQPTSD